MCHLHVHLVSTTTTTTKSYGELRKCLLSLAFNWERVTCYRYHKLRLSLTCYELNLISLCYFQLLLDLSRSKHPYLFTWVLSSSRLTRGLYTWVYMIWSIKYHPLNIVTSVISLIKTILGNWVKHYLWNLFSMLLWKRY